MQKRLIKFIAYYFDKEIEILKEVKYPFSKRKRIDVPVDAADMDPTNKRPGSTWAINTKFTLQTNDEGESAYIHDALLKRILK
jgi:hypothetical protein